MIMNLPSANLPALYKNRGCHPLLDETVVLYRHNDHIVRELVEVLLIKEHNNNNNNSVTKSSITLHMKEHAIFATMFVFSINRQLQVSTSVCHSCPSPLFVCFEVFSLATTTPTCSIAL